MPDPGEPTEAPTLFDAAPYTVAPRPSADPDLSADRRRTLRQQESIDAGRHPLTKGPLHPFAAPALTRPTAPVGRPFTCGSCRFRQLIGHHGRTYPKCTRDLTYGGHDAATASVSDVRNVSHSAGTDVRAWWPACVGYEAGDQGMSPDAARDTGDRPRPGDETP